MTHTTKHTPGPLHNITWHKPGPWIRQVLNDESEAYIHDKHCNAIARVYSLSDASLIAAAPAMYDALKAALDYYRGVFTGNTVTDKMMSSKLEHAIAQAEGRDK